MEFVGLTARPKTATPAAPAASSSVGGCTISTQVLRKTPVVPPCSLTFSVIKGMYNVRVADISPAVLKEVTEALTAKPRVNASYGGGKPVTYPLYSLSKTWLSVPRFYGLQRFGQCAESRLVDGQPVQLTLTVSPRPYQVPVLNALRGVFAGCDAVGAGALLEADCGVGKTFMGIAATVAHGKKTAVVVHKGDLQDQWKERFATFAPTARVGIVRSDTIEVDGYGVVIFMAQSVCSGRYDADRERVFGSFGLLIVDECHHWAAPTLSKTMSRFPARCVLALSATPDRKDGLGFVLPYFFGPTVARVKRNSTGKLRVEIINVSSGKAREIRLRNGRTCLPKTITMMVEDPARNRMLAEKVVALHGEGRSVILMSDRRKHLVELRRVLVEDLSVGEDLVGMYVGETSKRGIARREAQRSRPILLATTRMAEEGFDEARLDTLVFSTPKSSIEQCVGRIQRSHPDKKEPLVIDYVDTYAGGAMYGMARARENFYEACGFTVVKHRSGSGGDRQNSLLRYC